ncbi:MAG: sugar transferase [Calditrichia bacterium]
MKAFIIPTGDLSRFEPARNWFPELLLPVGNKPILTYQFEWLYDHGITDIKLIVRHMPYETRRYLKRGERWGCNVSYAISRDKLDLVSALRFYSDESEEGLVCAPARLLTSLHLKELMDRHCSMQADITISVPSSENDTSGVQPLELLSIEPFPVLILSSKAQKFIREKVQDCTLSDLIESMQNSGLRVCFHRSSSVFWYISSLDRLWELQCDISLLARKGFRLEGWQLEDDVWVGMNTRIHPSVRLEPPLIIGNNVSIERGVHLGCGSVIGNNVVVDSNSSVLSSTIMRDSYIGCDVDIHDAIVNKKSLVSMPAKVQTLIHDQFMLGDVKISWYANYLARFVHGFIALFMLILFSVVIIGDILIRTVQGRRTLSRLRRTSTRVKHDLDGTIHPTYVNLYLSSGGVTLLDRLPGLWNVVCGDIRLIGVAPLKKEEYETLSEKWKTERSTCPTGLFQLWDADGIRNPDPLEREVSERYYLRTRSFRGDLLLFFNVFWEMLVRPFRKANGELGGSL